MAMRSIIRLLSGVLLFLSQYALAWEVSCPAVVETRASTTELKSGLPETWQLSPRYMSRLWLSGIGVTQGKPENLIDLKPETEKEKGESWSVWEIENAGDKENNHYWISCIYGHEQIWLTQPIPASSKRCKTRDFEGSPEAQSVSFICN